MIPFRMTWLAMPTFSSSRLSLSNFSGVSLLRILQNESQNLRQMFVPSQDPTAACECENETHPLTLRKMASFCSSGCLASRLVMLGGIHRLGALVAAAPWLETWGGLSSLCDKWDNHESLSSFAELKITVLICTTDVMTDVSPHRDMVFVHSLIKDS